MRLLQFTQPNKMKMENKNNSFKMYEAILCKEGIFVDLAEDGLHLLDHDGTYFRMVGDAEANEIVQKGKPIHIREGFTFQIASKWQHICTVVDVDDSDFYAPQSRNGGKYSIRDNYSYYWRNNAGTIEFLCLPTSKSSCEVTQTWEGDYVSKFSWVKLIDTDPYISLIVSAEESADKDDSIMCYGMRCSPHAMFRDNRYISSKWDPHTGNYRGEPKTTERPLTDEERGDVWALITSTTGMELPKYVKHRVREAYKKALYNLKHIDE